MTAAPDKLGLATSYIYVICRIERSRYCQGLSFVAATLIRHTAEHAEYESNNGPRHRHSRSELAEMDLPSLRELALRVRFHIIRNARIENVGKSQSCMFGPGHRQGGPALPEAHRALPWTRQPAAAATRGSGCLRAQRGVLTADAGTSALWRYGTMA